MKKSSRVTVNRGLEKTRTVKGLTLCLVFLGAAVLFLASCENPVDDSPSSFTVAYDGNGADDGTVPTDNNAYEAGASVTVRGNTGGLTKSGYTFAGWNTAANSGGTSYAANDTFAMPSSNVTLYARWTANDSNSTIAINNPSAPAFSITPATFSLELGGGTTTQTVSVSPGTDVTISSYEWFVNGSSRGNELSIKLDTAANSDWFQLGVNTFTLVVVIDGLPYSEDFTFTVEQN